VLGRIYECGGFEDIKSGKYHPILKKNNEKALTCYEIAAEQENELALNFLGAYAYNVQKKEEDAVKYFRRAAASGTCPRALNNLALCFENGVGSCQ
jgi:TPR repeat protein